MTTTTPKFSVTFDDGAHNTTIEEFINKSDAMEFFQQQVERYKSGDDSFYSQFTSDDYDAVIELCELDDEGFYGDTVECFDKDYDN